MNLRKITVASALASAVTCGVAFAQTSGLYVYHSDPQGGCPALDWHITVTDTTTGNDLTGMVAWDQMQHMARVSGKVDPNSRQFQMTAQELGGQGRTANIDGIVGANGVITANMSGEGVNCKGFIIRPYKQVSGGQ
jgi:hypothetical protein